MSDSKRSYQEWYETLSSEDQKNHIKSDEITAMLIEPNPSLSRPHLRKGRQMNNTEMALDYYKTAALQTGRGPWPKPKYVPKRIRILKLVQSDLTMFENSTNRREALPGNYEAHVNPLGAVSVETDGGLLGVMLDEFEVVEWQENPHNTN